MESLLLECFVRAALIASGTAVILWAMRIKSAATRHAAWTAVVIAMLLLPIWSSIGPKISLRVLRPPASPIAAVASSPVAPPADLASSEMTPADIVSGRNSTRPLAWPDALIAVYLLGACVLLARLMIGSVLALMLRRSAVIQGGRATSSRCVSPITVGWLDPVLILPEGWHQWTSAKLDAVLTHEGEHARRRDPLVQWLALLNRAILWFHPLAWWLERRLATLSEEACDAAVLAAGHSPRDYSQYLLDLARSVAHEGRRIRAVGMAMPGSGLTQRLHQIFDGLPAAPISRARIVCTVAFSAMSSVMFAAGTLAPRQDLAPGVKADAAQQKYEVASIKPCASEALPPIQSGARAAGPGNATTSPGRAHWDCITLGELANLAYAGPYNRLLNSLVRQQPGQPQLVRGGPSWVYSDKFVVDVKAPGAADRETMIGPMLRALLEDRFKLKTHRATEERTMYALTVAKDGLKIKRTEPADCREYDPSQPPSGPPQPGDVPSCGNMHMNWNGGNRTLTLTGTTLQSFTDGVLSGLVMDRFVINRTGLEERFNIPLEFAPDDSTPGGMAGLAWSRREGATPATGPSIFKALEQLGLKLESTKAMAEYLVIDRVERPTPNIPAFAGASAGKPLTRAQGAGR
jgi:bla regulator protein blaR1